MSSRAGQPPRRREDGHPGVGPAPRSLRCPMCRRQFETMRRFRLACTECGHEWEEESVLTTADKIADARTAIGESLVMGAMWLGFLGAPPSSLAHSFTSSQMPSAVGSHCSCLSD